MPDVPSARGRGTFASASRAASAGTRDCKRGNMSFDQQAPEVTDIGGSVSSASAWDRVKDVLRLKPGVFAGIAADTSATSQGFVVFGVATAIGNIWLVVLLPVVMAFALAAIAVESVLFMVVSKLFTDSVPGFGAWFRTFLFASAPSVFSLIPLVGWFIALCYALIIAVLVVRELAQIATVQAVLVLIISVVIPGMLVILLAITVAIPFIPAFLRDLLGW